MNIRWLLAPLLALSVLGAAPSERGGIVAGPARLRLAQDRDAQTGGVAQVERAYCVTRYSVAVIPWQSIEGETRIYVVTEVEPAQVTGAKAWEIQNVTCPAMRDGSPVPMLHTHPASRCDQATGACQADSSRMLPGRCVPSSIDVATVNRLMLPFSVVQCARGVFTFFAPNLAPESSP